MRSQPGPRVIDRGPTGAFTSVAASCAILASACTGTKTGSLEKRLLFKIMSW